MIVTCDVVMFYGHVGIGILNNNNVHKGVGVELCFFLFAG